MNHKETAYKSFEKVVELQVGFIGDKKVINKKVQN